MTEPVKVLVIEDDVAICSLLADVLTADGYTVETLPCGWDAVNVVKAWKPSVILIDILLPRVTGYQVLRAIRLVTTTTPVFLMSAHTQIDDVLLRFLRAQGFLPKEGFPGGLTFIEAIEAAVGSVTKPPEPPPC